MLLLLIAADGAAAVVVALGSKTAAVGFRTTPASREMANVRSSDPSGRMRVKPAKKA